MVEIDGVLTQINSKGEITHLTIDVEKHRNILAPLLDELKMSERIEFEAKWKKGISPDQMKENLHKRIEKLWVK